MPWETEPGATGSKYGGKKMIVKKTTKKLQTEYPNLVINKGCWGYYCTDSRLRKQSATVHSTITKLLTEVKNGIMPANAEVKK